jgi:hypothetical protein
MQQTTTTNPRESSTPAHACPMCREYATNRFGGLYTATCWRLLDHPATISHLRIALHNHYEIETSDETLARLTRSQRGAIYAWIFGPHPRPHWISSPRKAPVHE